MPQIVVTKEELRVKLSYKERMWAALTASTIIVPLKLVEGVRVHPQEAVDAMQSIPQGVQLGVALPSKYVIASFYHPIAGTPPEFYCVAREPARCLALDMAPRAPYSKLILQVDEGADVEAIRKSIEVALRRTKSGF
eukprot:tig00021244_g19585.t1